MDTKIDNEISDRFLYEILDEVKKIENMLDDCEEIICDTNIEQNM